MKKMFYITIVIAMLSCFSSCYIDAPLRIPYGKWENTEWGIVLDINPEIVVGEDMSGWRWRRFPGTYFDGEKTIDIYIQFQVDLGRETVLIFAQADCDREAIPSSSVGRIRAIRRNRFHLYFRHTHGGTGEEMDIGGEVIFVRIVE